MTFFFAMPHLRAARRFVMLPIENNDWENENA
jgi:hypothetical protein